jgi:hypothetical protein
MNKLDKNIKMEDEMKRNFTVHMCNGKLCVIFRCLVFIIMSLSITGSMEIMLEHDAHAQNNSATDSPIIQIREGDEWYYFKGIQSPPHEWNRNDFDYRNWLKGPSGLGYGVVSNKTNLGDMKGNYLTVYARKEFTISNIYSITGMTLSVVCDGPYKAYLNDIEVIRNNSVNINQSAEWLNISGFIHELMTGKNVLAIECSNDDINSKDFSFIPIFEVFEQHGGDIQ